MKKILGSVGVLAVVGALVLGATGAFFSDTETSTGNTFTAGAIDLKVDSEQHYNGKECVEGVWTPVDNNYPNGACGGTWGQQTPEDIINQKFFSFADIKPGDSGENTISLHVDNNDAWVCAEVSNLVSADNGETEPEALVDQSSDVNAGELDDQMLWTIWRDDGDNIMDDGETALLSGHPVNGVLALYDSATGNGALLGNTTTYLGVKWELPAASGNESQTDSLTADISFTAVQSRNNENFRCVPVPQREIISTQGNTWASVDGQFTEAWQADGRWGDGGTTAAENEVRIGEPGGSNPIVQAHGNNSTGPWRNDIWEDFSLVYDGTEAIFTIGNVIIDSSNNSGKIVGANGKLGITIKTKSSGETVMVSNVKLDGASPTGPDAVSASDGAKASLVLSGDTELSDGFSITGKVKLSWGGNPTSNESMGILFQIEN